jgi:LemA protein
MNAKSIESKVAANNELNGAVKTLFAVAENYPDLKANQNFINLQEELSDIENKLAASRRYFNSATKEYNIAIQTFPSVLIANTF